MTECKLEFYEDMKNFVEESENEMLKGTFQEVKEDLDVHFSFALQRHNDGSQNFTYTPVTQYGFSLQKLIKEEMQK